MWTVMDGRENKTEALGIQITRDDAGRSVAAFREISAEIYERIIEDSEKDRKGGKDEENIIVRFELTESDFDTSHGIYQIWEKYVATRKLPYADPYQNGLEFLSKATEGLRQCGDKVKLNRPTRLEREEIARLNPPQQMIEYIRMTRKQNGELHVSNSMFPWVWRPLIQQP